MIKLNQNSLTARFYKWFFVKNSLPTNLCPYFWKLLLAFVLIVPYTILSLPMFLLLSITDRLGNTSHSIERPVIGGVIYFCLFLLFCVGSAVAMFFVEYEKNGYMYTCAGVGFLIIFSSILFGIISLIEYIINYYNNKPVTKNTFKESNVFVEFIKAKYKNYCPKIDWYNKK